MKRIKQIIPANKNVVAAFADGDEQPVIVWALMEHDEDDVVWEAVEGLILEKDMYLLATVFDVAGEFLEYRYIDN